MTLYLQLWLSYFVEQHRTFKKIKFIIYIINLKNNNIFFIYIYVYRLDLCVKDDKIKKFYFIFKIVFNLNLDVIDQGVENVIENDDIDQVCLFEN